VCEVVADCTVFGTAAEGYVCSSGSRRGRPKREENQEEKPKEDDSEQETTNDATNDKSDGKPSVSGQYFVFILIALL
jgi:hypothetical protein